MRIIICSPKKILYRGEGKKVTCQTSVGEITILDYHRPLITDICPGIIRLLDLENKEHFFEAKSGFLEVNYLNSLKILINDI